MGLRVLLLVVAVLLATAQAVEDDLQVFFLFVAIFLGLMLASQEKMHERRVLVREQQARRRRLLRAQLALRRRLIREEHWRRRHQLRQLQQLEVPKDVAEEAREKLREFQERQLEQVRRAERRVRRSTRRRHRTQRDLLREVQHSQEETADQRLTDDRIWSL